MRAALVAALVALPLLAAGCGGGDDEAGAARGVASAYLAAQGPAVCGFLDRRQLASFADGEVPGVVACRRAKQLVQGDVVADSVEARGPLRIVAVDVSGGRARVEALDRLGRSVELDLVREEGEWRVAAVPDEIAGDASAVGRRLPPTESALFDALLFGPAPGDAVALREALRLTRSWLALVERDGGLAPADREAKLRWALRLTADGSCDPCRALLRAARPRLG